MPARAAAVRTVPPYASSLFGACAVALCLAGVAIVGWLAAWGFGSLLRIFNPWSGYTILGPIGATIYVTALALPPAVIVGMLAAAGLADVRILGGSAPGLRRAITLIGSIPTVVLTFAVLVAAIALGWQPNLTTGALAVAAVNLPLSTALVLAVLGPSTTGMRESATALGAAPAYVLWNVLMPTNKRRLWAAIVSVAVQMLGGAAVIVLLAGARLPGGAGEVPVNAWPLAVEIWNRSADPAGYGATAAAALVLTACLWLFQEQLRAGLAGGASQEHR